MWRSKSKY